LPTEDSWVTGELPIEKQMIWAWGTYEQRYTYLPEELKGWRPLWINGEFLRKGSFKNGRLTVGDQSFSSLYVDVKYLDIEALIRISELAGQGLPVCMKQIPLEPGLKKSNIAYQQLLGKLSKLENVKSEWSQMKKGSPLVTGTEQFDYWCRSTDDGLTFFFANPKSQHLTFPMEYGQSLNDKKSVYPIEISYQGKKISLVLEFDPYQSKLLTIDKSGKIINIDISFVPKTPIFKARIKKGKEPWEV
jgi:hypothetical protein